MWPPSLRAPPCPIAGMPSPLPPMMLPSSQVVVGGRKLGGVAVPTRPVARTAPGGVGLNRFGGLVPYTCGFPGFVNCGTKAAPVYLCGCVLVIAVDWDGAPLAAPPLPHARACAAAVIPAGPGAPDRGSIVCFGCAQHVSVAPPSTAWGLCMVALALGPGERACSPAL